MLDYFLSNNGFIVFQAIIMSIILTPLVTTYVYSYSKIVFNHKIFLIGIICTIILAIIGFKILTSINKNIVSEVNWKQIYKNDIDAKVIIEKNSFLGNIMAGEKLGDKYKIINIDNNAEIKIEKDNTSYSKKIQINKNNIIINGELNENSKITKIEYRNIQGTRRILFDHKGPIEKSDIDGEIRITIDQDPKQEELKQIFESQN